MRNATPCSVTGCIKTADTAEMCKAHYFRVRRNGHPGGPEIKVKGLPKLPCSVDGCDSPQASRGLCDKHYQRLRNHGDVYFVTPRTGENNPCYRGDRIGIGAAHERVRASRGKADQYTCTACGERAKHWAYNHADPNEKQASRGNVLMPYSVDPAYYQPMCVPCHKVYDLAHIAATRHA